MIRKYALFLKTIEDGVSGLIWHANVKYIITGESDAVYYIGEDGGISKELEGRVYLVSEIPVEWRIE